MDSLTLSLPKVLTPMFLAVFFTTIPLSFVMSVLTRLPPPLAASHRRWPDLANLALIATMTAAAAAFIRRAYFNGYVPPASVAAEFLLVLLLYAFALVLLFRQFAGVYPAFIVTVGWTGLALRKTNYRNISRVEKRADTGSETRFRIETVRGDSVMFALPSRYVSIFEDRLRRAQEGD